MLVHSQSLTFRRTSHYWFSIAAWVPISTKSLKTQKGKTDVSKVEPIMTPRGRVQGALGVFTEANKFLTFPFAF